MDDPRRPTVIHVVNKLEGGGTERTLVRLLRAFDPTAMRHVVVTLREAGALTATLPDHVICRPLGASGRDRFAAWRLAKILYEERAMLVHARNTGCWFDSLAACVLHPPTALVLGFHGLDTQPAFSPRQRRIGRWAVRCGARFTSVSQAGARRMMREMNLPEARVAVLRNGVLPTKLAEGCENGRRRVRAEFDLQDDHFVVGGVGSLTSIKRFDVLIEAVASVARHHGQVRLVLVGDGPLRSALRRRVEAAGIESKVRLVGARDDVPELLWAFDGYVCSSDSEEVSNAMLEAMAAGLPIITTDVGDHGGIVQEGDAGFVIATGDVNALAERITEWISDSVMRRQQAEAALRRSREFEFAGTVRAYEAYYRSFMECGTVLTQVVSSSSSIGLLGRGGGPLPNGSAESVRVQASPCSTSVSRR